MAQKAKDSFENTKQVLREPERVLEFNVPGDIDNKSLTNMINHCEFEVGNKGSSFAGTDSYGNEIKAITYSRRTENMSRFDVATAVGDTNDVLDRDYIYSQEYEGQSLKKQIPKYESESKPNDGYEEKYFQHIFNWPTTHKLRNRRVGGFILEKLECTTKETTNPTDGTDSTSTSSTTTTYEGHNPNIETNNTVFSDTFTLDHVESEIYLATAGSTAGTWNYSPIITNSIGEVQNGGILGKPVIYHGGTNDDAIFFNYLPGADATLTSNISHTFNDVETVNQNLILTSSNSNITVTAISQNDPGGNDNSLLRKHYEIRFNTKKLQRATDVRITVNQNVTASGLTEPGSIVVSKLVLKDENTVKVWFESPRGVKTYVQDWSVGYGNSGLSTIDVVAIGDTINGATVTNVVNYAVEVGLRRTVNAHPAKGAEDKRITESQFLALNSEYTISDFQNVRSWLRLNDVSDVDAGMVIVGEGIKEGTLIAGVDTNERIVYINSTLASAKPKLVKIINDEVNRISKHTLCYATISGGSDFSVDTDYDVSRNGSSTGIQVKVRAGKGIINRSAIVGTYFSNKKRVEYQPIFYSADSSCSKEIYADENGEYTLGTIIWGDGTRLEEKYLMTRPITRKAYQIASIFLSFTNAPIDKDTFETFLSAYEQDNNVVNMYYNVNSYVNSNLEGKKAALITDDICRDEITLEYFQPYDPYLEQQNINESIQNVNNSIVDDCVVDNPLFEEPQSSTMDQVQSRFKDIIENSISQSSILSEDYYNKLIRDEDSLFNRIQNGSNLLRDSTPETRVSELPPQIEGEDASGKIFTKSNYRDIPPAFDRVKYFTTDLHLPDDRSIDARVDLDPHTTYNQPVLVVRSKPCWLWDDNNYSYVYNIVDGTLYPPGSENIPNTVTRFSTSFTINVTQTSDGFVDKIEVDTALITTEQPVDTPVTPSVGTGGPGGQSDAVSTTTEKTCTRTVDWKSPEGNDEGLIAFGTRSAYPGNYTLATNWYIPPGRRDLRYQEREDDNQIGTPEACVHPKVIWQPDVNYQRDFFKMFNFRMNEISQMIGETINNQGNPFIDDPIIAKLSKDIKSSDTTIHVRTTAGFFSSGYLIIPKYQKKVFTSETGNNSGYYTYSGEEIIYYGSKTETTFENCVRGCYGTNSTFEVSVSINEIEPGVRYKIKTLGDTNWEQIGAGSNPNVGDVFVATSTGKGNGIVEIFGSNSDTTPDNSTVDGIQTLPKVAVISSYEKGFGIAQYNSFRLRA